MTKGAFAKLCKRERVAAVIALGFALATVLALPAMGLLPSEAYSVGDDAVQPQEWEDTDPDGNGLHVNKYASDNGDGSYTITLEQWLDGVESEAPLDIVMVLDVSGSMADQYMEPVYASELESDLVYWIKLSDGHYHPISYCGYCGLWYVFDSDSYGTATAEHRYYANRYGSYGLSRQYYHANYNYYYTPKTSYGSSGSQFYRYYQGKLTDLKEAAHDLIEVVSRAAEEEGIDHRISLIKFADDLNYSVGNDSVTFSTSVGTGTGNCTQVVSPLQNALENQAGLDAAVDSLYAEGSTRTDYALQMAQHVLDQEASNRQQVVVLFTDGEPQDEMGDLTVDWDPSDVDVANRAIATAAELKGAGVQVFTVGLLPDLDDAVPATSATPSTVTQKNSRLLHALSSNYPQATSMDALGSFSGVDYDSRYFYGTSDSKDLTAIFDTIAHKALQSAKMPLTSDAIVQDVVTAYFDVQLESLQCFTQEYDGFDFSDELEPLGLEASISGSEDGTTTIRISGFDFQQEYVMPVPKEDGTYGRKLVVRFSLWPKDDFLGGNSVPTNTAQSGVWESSKQEDAYPQPTVNVPLSPLSLDTQDKRVYLLDDANKDELLEGCRLSYQGRRSGSWYPVTFDKMGNPQIDWQDDYAVVGWKVFDNYDSPLTADGFREMTEDQGFVAKATVSALLPAALSSQGNLLAPNRFPGAAAFDVEAQDDAKVYVYKPILTFKDAMVSYGSKVPIDAWFDDHDYEAAKIQWENSVQGTAEGKQFLHQEPGLTLSYQVDPLCVELGMVATVDDIPVSVRVARDDVEVTPYVTFVHHDCNTADALVRDSCSWQQQGAMSDAAFLLHVDASYELPSAGWGEDWLRWIIGGLLISVFPLYLARRLALGRRRWRAPNQTTHSNN